MKLWTAIAQRTDRALGDADVISLVLGLLVAGVVVLLVSPKPSILEYCILAFAVAAWARGCMR